MEDSEFLFKGACPACESSDACAIYDDGHRHCFSCGKTFPPDDIKEPSEPSPAPKLSKKFLGSNPVALPARKILKATCVKFGYSVAGQVQVSPYYWKRKLVAQHTRGRNKDFKWIGDVKHLELFGQHLWQSRQ